MPSRTGRGISMLLALGVALSSVLLLVGPAQAKAQKSSLTATSATAIVSEQVTFTGVVPSKNRARPVLLQRYIGGRWVHVASGRTTTRGVFKVVSRAPGSVGRYAYRVLAPKARVSKKRLSAVLTPSRVVTVTRQVASFTVPATGEVNKAFTVTSKFAPARLGRRVQVQEIVSGAWKVVGTGTEDRTGVTRVSVTVPGPTLTTRSFRAVALARSAAAAFASPTRVVKLAGDPLGLPQGNAVDTTPRVVDDSVVTDAGVRELRQIGSTMYAGGDFNTVKNAAGTATYTRTNLFSFDAVTGAVSTWAPVVNGPVYTMEPSADGRYLYIGGEFNRFDGLTVNRLVKYDLQTGAVDQSFVAPLTTNRVSDLQLVGGQLFASGAFTGSYTGGIVALDPTTGAKSAYFDSVQAAGMTGAGTHVYRFAVNPAATRMVILGSFTSVGGQPRRQAAMIELGADTATLSPWYSPRWDLDCSSASPWYTRAVGWAPDGSYFAIGNTGAGYPGTAKLCDTVTRWNPVDAPNQQPVWIQYSGGDTFQSLTVTKDAVFVGGHFRWLDNPLGRDSKGAGAVSRVGLGALNPATGKAYLWNPTKSVEGGQGAFAVYFTTRGLWVGHFERYLGVGPNGPELHEGLGLLPF